MLETSDTMLENVRVARVKILKNIVEYVDGRFFQNKPLADVMTQPDGLLSEMLKDIIDEVMGFFEKASSRKIITDANLSYQSKYLNNEEWGLIENSSNSSFDPQNFCDDEKSTFHYATKAEGIIFFPTKEQAIQAGKYTQTVEEMQLPDFPKGSILCYGFKVYSRSKSRCDKNRIRIIYIQAVLTMSTSTPLTTECSDEKSRIEIQNNLEEIIFKHYKEKMKIELINFFVQRRNKELQERYEDNTTLEEAQLLYQLENKKIMSYEIEKVKEMRGNIEKIFKFLKSKDNIGSSYVGNIKPTTPTEKM